MTAATSTITTTPPRQLGRSVLAGLAGFFATAGLSLATDQILHVLNVYPPWGEPMWNPWLNALALAYRTVFTIGGGYITAMLAPYAPMRLVAILGAVGTVFATAGAITAISIGNFGPNWYPIALAVTGFPCVWVGGLLHEHGARRRP